MTDAPLVALEASRRRGSVAVRAGGRVREAELDRARRHASDLLPRLAGLLDELLADAAAGGAAREDGRVRLGGVVVGTGPGSFTGVRVAIATALGLARGSGAPARGVPSFEALALDALAPGERAAVLADARAGGVYVARYARLEDDVEPLLAPRVVAPDAVAALLVDEEPILGEPGIERAARLDEAARARLRVDAEPRAAALLRLGARRLEREGGEPLDAIHPLYLRPFGA